MRSLRSIVRSRFALALVLLGSLAQQVGAIAHGAIPLRSGAPVDPLHEICTSAGLVRVPDAPEPAQPPASAGGTCNLCATATTTLLPAAPADAVAAAPRLRDRPALAVVPALSSRAQSAYRSRAPPVLPSV